MIMTEMMRKHVAAAEPLTSKMKQIKFFSLIFPILVNITHQSYGYKVKTNNILKLSVVYSKFEKIHCHQNLISILYSYI